MQTPLNVDRRVLSRKIKEQALAAGFDKVGIVAAAALEPERERLRQWLARGYQGEMKWMARDPDQRADPRAVFPSARSVLAVALNYYTPHKHSLDPGAGKVSRYAWGHDYHEVLSEKLRALLSWIKEECPQA